MTNREIDELVHHDVMGVERPPKGWSLTNPIPQYSTDPAASKQLRDKMRADGRYFFLSSERHDFACEWFYPAPDTTPDGLRQAKAIGPIRADAEELAVALAALRTVGVEVEGK